MGSILYMRIKELCEEQGISISKLEGKLGFSNSVIGKWKNGGSPSIDSIRPIANYFDVSTDYLIGLSDLPARAEAVIGDADIISMQRAKSRMTPKDKDRMMKMLRIGFDYAFDDDDEEP